MQFTRSLVTGVAFVGAYVLIVVVIWPAIRLWWEVRRSGAIGSGGMGFVSTSFSLLPALMAFLIGFLWQWFR